MTFADEEGNTQVLFNYPEGPVRTLFLSDKTKESVYILIVQSDKVLNENAINIFNLN